MGITKQQKRMDLIYQIQNCRDYLIRCPDNKPIYERLPFKNLQRLKGELNSL